MASDAVPIGYRFMLTDEELVVHYLANKVDGRPLPGAAVAEADVYATEPWNLLGDHRREAYFFAQRKRKSAGRSRVDRRAGNGSWTFYSREQHITSLVGGVEVVVGSKRSLYFNDGQRKNSGWAMHEYELASASASTGFQTLVLCHVKKSSSSVSSGSQLMKRRRDECAVTEAQQQSQSLLISSVDFECFSSSKKARLVDPANLEAHQQQPWQQLGNCPSCSLPAMTPYADQDPAFSLPAPSMRSNIFDHVSIPSPGVDVAASAETPNLALPSSTASTTTGSLDAAVDNSAMISNADLEAFWKKQQRSGAGAGESDFGLDIVDKYFTAEELAELEAFLKDDSIHRLQLIPD